MKEVRVCEFCSYHNDISVLECVDCGYDLSFVLIQTIEETERQETEHAETQPEEEVKESSIDKVTSVMKPCRFVSIKDSYSFMIPLEGGIMGREGEIEPDYFDQSNFISRQHAKVQYIGAELYILDLGSRNGTFVNQIRLKQGEEHSLNHDDKVKLADMEFEIQI